MLGRKCPIFVKNILKMQKQADFEGVEKKLEKLLTLHKTHGQVTV